MITRELGGFAWLHCEDCHHEFYGRVGETCDWCGGGSYVLDRMIGFLTPLVPLLGLLGVKHRHGQEQTTQTEDPSTDPAPTQGRTKA